MQAIFLKSLFSILFLYALPQLVLAQEIIGGWQIFNTSNSSIPDNHICDVKIDDKDVLWVATWSGGVGRYERNSWKVFSPANSLLPSASVNQLEFGKDDKVWAATNGGGIASFDGAAWSSVALPTNDNTALCIAVSPKGDKLVGTPNDGLFLVDKSNHVAKIWGRGEALINRVHHVTFDHNGDALVSTAQGLLKFSKTVRDGYTTTFKVLRSEHTLRSLVDTDGSILAIDFKTGHIFTQKNERWSEMKNPTEGVLIALNNNNDYDYSASTMTAFKSGRIVVGTRYFGGLAVYNEKEGYWSPILPPYAGYDLQGGVKCLAEGENQSIWVGTYQQGLMIPAEEKPEPDSALVNFKADEAEVEKVRRMLQQRRVVIKDTVRVRGGEVELMVWDAQKPDGDIITLIFNGKVLLDKYEVTKTPARVRLIIEPNKPNKLVMYAHNLGEVAPNTASLSILNIEGQKELQLTSDLVNAGALIIIEDVIKVIETRGKVKEE